MFLRYKSFCEKLLFIQKSKLAIEGGLPNLLWSSILFLAVVSEKKIGQEGLVMIGI